MTSVLCRLMTSKRKKQKQWRRFWQGGDEPDEEFEERQADVLDELNKGNVVMRSTEFEYTDRMKVVIDKKGRSYTEKPWPTPEGKEKFRTFIAFEIRPGQEFEGKAIEENGVT